VFETALDRLAADAHLSGKTIIRRVLTDNAGIAYGMSGNLAKARTIFLKGIALPKRHRGGPRIRVVLLQPRLCRCRGE